MPKLVIELFAGINLLKELSFDEKSGITVGSPNYSCF